eukprot:CAMPEP_0170525016 /NCGR_PEP_ID=MMETSP0209-20121228/10470_1 /TAXON_ID=665100 ORGANISM="Litonotus pictus, Strain P1" /NCGR_SAMPLE_ID=MMETSP0209 /ASSEMBLY_ACC=CAM_ASM_000301 /LENGTH=339 /DNA_ID=CAMNT_0010814037 /DNA_START=19 /DNA_END=1034 /DNA_ORIENTATION=-
MAEKSGTPIFNTKDIFSDKKIDCSDFDSNKSSIRQKATELLEGPGVCVLSKIPAEDAGSLVQYFKLISPDIIQYQGGSASRNQLADKQDIYDTGVPGNVLIQPHVEMSYQVFQPKYVSFTLLEAPGNGQGSSFICDNVAATRKLLKTSLGKKVREKGITHWRRFHNELDHSFPEQVKMVSWQQSFSIKTKEALTDYFIKNKFQYEWLENDNLAIKNSSNAFNYCDKADANLLFFGTSNHACYFDSYNLEMQKVPDRLRPFDFKFGDEEEWTSEELEVMNSCYDGELYNYNYEEGDMLIFHNKTWQHGRMPFSLPPGRKRNLCVMLGEKCYPEAPRHDKW